MKSKYTIGEIAKIYKISTDTLRFYEKQGLLVPKRLDNSYRYYSIFDIWKLNVIKTMKSLGIRLKDIKLFLENRSIDSEISLLEEEYYFLEEEIEKLVYQKNNIKNRVEILKNAKKFRENYKIHYMNLPLRKVSYIKANISIDEEVDLAYTKLSHIVDQKIYFLNRDFGMTVSIDEAKKNNFNHYSKAFLIIDDDEMKYDGVLERGKYLMLKYKGAYSNAEKAYQILFEEINSKRLETENFFIEKFIIDNNLTDNENEYLTEIQIRIID